MSVVMCIAYILIVFVLIEGFKVEKILHTSVFSIITAAIGFCIMQMLKVQGQTFAKNLEKNKRIREDYSNRKGKKGKRRYKSMKGYWVKSAIGDVLIKCFTLALSSVGMIYIMVEGSGDYSLLLLAAVNLLMFAGFGLISLCKAYDFYNEEYVPYMLHEIESQEASFEEKQITITINKGDNENENDNEREITKSMEMAKNTSGKQRDDMVHNSGRTDILESSDNNGNTLPSSESTSMVNSSCNDSILGRTIHTSNATSACINSVVEEDSSKTYE